MNKLLYTLVLASSALASSNGAKKCEISAEQIGSAMGGINKDLGYKIECEGGCNFQKNSPLTLKLSGTDDFKGFQMYVTDASGKGRYGTFKIPTGYKDCSQNCKGDASKDSMITHTSSASKPANSKFEWIPSDIKECKDLKLVVAIVKKMEEFQVIDNITLKCSGDTPNSTSSSQSVSSSSAQTTTLSSIQATTPSPAPTITSSQATTSDSSTASALPTSQPPTPIAPEKSNPISSPSSSPAPISPGPKPRCKPKQNY